MNNLRNLLLGTTFAVCVSGPAMAGDPYAGDCPYPYLQVGSICRHADSMTPGDWIVHNKQFEAEERQAVLESQKITEETIDLKLQWVRDVEAKHLPEGDAPPETVSGTLRVSKSRPNLAIFKAGGEDLWELVHLDKLSDAYKAKLQDLCYAFSCTGTGLFSVHYAGKPGDYLSHLSLLDGQFKGVRTGSKFR